MATTRPESIDRIAKRALREVEKPDPDLLKDGFPFEPSWVQIVVQAIKPRNISDGGLELVAISEEADAIQCTVARVLKCGPAAMDGVTEAGIPLNKFLPGISKPEELIGRYVIFQLHTGQELTLRKTGQKIRVMRVTDLLGVTDDPHAWKFYV